MTTKTIQSAGGDYATMALAYAGLAASAPISDAWVFEVNNEQIVETTSSTWTAVSGQSATNTVTLQPQTGEGFADLNDYSSAVLDYPSSGARFTTTTSGVVWTFGAHMIVQGLAFKHDAANYANTMALSGDNIKFQRNILRVETRGGGVTLECANAGTKLIANNCIFHTDASGALNEGMCHTSSTATTHWIANTIVISRVTSGSTSSGHCLMDKYSGNPPTTFPHQNAFYIFDSTNGRMYREVGDATGTYGNYNVQNGTAGDTIIGTGNAENGDFEADFEDPSAASITGAVDMRPQDGGLLIALIPAASRYTGDSGITLSAANTDIRGQTRLGVANDCGCFQKTVAAPSSGAPPAGVRSFLVR